MRVVHASELASSQGGTVELLPRGSLAISPTREHLVRRSIPGAYNPDGSLAVDTLRTVGEKIYRHTVPERLAPQGQAEVREEEVVWGGNILGRYGHFLLESVARLWATLPGAELAEAPAVFTTPWDSPFATEWLAAFGAKTVAMPESGVVLFKRMRVPEPAWMAGAWTAPELRDVHLHARDRMQVAPMPRHDVLWLSRAGLPRRRVAYDEALLEWLLEGHVTPVRLEELSLAEQVGTLESSRAVAGVVGSAFHTLLLTSRQPDSLYLCPPSERTNYTAQHRLLSAEATFASAVDGTMRMRRSRERWWPFPGSYRILIPEALFALAGSVLPGAFDDRRIAAFAKGGRDPGLRPGAALRDALDEAALRVLREPFSFDARMTLAAEFENRDLGRCALEQYTMVAELSEDRAAEAQAKIDAAAETAASPC